MRATLVHIVDSAWQWRLTCTGFYNALLPDEEYDATELTEAKFPTLHALEERWQAGSAIHWPDRSQIGGLQTGDEFPYPNPWERQEELRPRRPPMVLWSDPLNNDDEAVVIASTIWEWDGGQDIISWWSAAVAQNAPRIVGTVLRIIAAVKGDRNLSLPADLTSELENAMSPASELEIGLFRQAGDRPIGMVHRNRFKFHTRSARHSQFQLLRLEQRWLALPADTS